MRRLQDTVRGFKSIRAWIKEATRRINGLANFKVTRSGNNDSIQITENAIILNLQSISSIGQSIGQEAPGFAFQIVSSGENLVQVLPGTVNGFLPTGLLTDISVSSSGTDYIYARINASAGVVSSVSIVSNSSTPSGYGSGLLTAPATFDLFIGSVTDGSVIHQAQADNAGFYVEEQFTTTDGTWYTWVQTN